MSGAGQGLGPGERTDALSAMRTQTFDVLVVGGGVVGAGCALDAATRGLSVALVEARDWASGTSSRSSKLIHGGLRYLEMLDFRLVLEALRERGLILTRLAPHLTRPVPFLYPLQHRGWERPYVTAGLTLYDAMARTGSAPAGLPMHKHLTRKQALRLARQMQHHDAVGGAVIQRHRSPDHGAAVRVGRERGLHLGQLLVPVGDQFDLGLGSRHQRRLGQPDLG